MGRIWVVTLVTDGMHGCHKRMLGLLPAVRQRRSTPEVDLPINWRNVIGSPMTRKPKMSSEIINRNLRKFARLEKLINSADNSPEFEGLLRRYETIYDVTNTLMNREMDRQGYLLTVCANGDKVAFARKGKEYLIPEGYIVYIDEEVRLLEVAGLVYEMKKLTRAEVMEVETKPRYPCYKGDGFCRLAESQPLSGCVYEPSNCRWKRQR